ncbi:cysteine-rich receptor-like protein kinase 25 [Neltuma alba]|uniref:cysteine-rich receptor-like protein kinase 25 n=1 Tax=Neltuma alba TaxID=207710 RepID=UPI0010A2F635|nr:cysteine-rich receptor-like protein kinase 25 [Prosopis alba]
MPSSNSKYVVLFLSFSFLIFLTEADPIYSAHACTDSITYKPKTTFETNLNLLLSSLPSKASDGSHFYRTRTGNAAPDAVNGLFLCRGDILAAACQECVSAAAEEIKRRCPDQKEAIIWYDVCMLRYSNQSFNKIVPSTDLSNTKEIAPEDKDRFNELLSGLLNSVAAKVLKSQTKFATDQVNFTATETLYGLEQCTPDLTVFDCNTCLRSAIAALPNCCDGKRGATVLLPACNIRYEFYPFFNSPPPVSHSLP